MSKLNIDEKYTDEIKDLFSEDNQVLSLCFFNNYKVDPKNLKYLIYYYTRESCWKLNTDVSNDYNMYYSAATQKSIIDDILSEIYNMTGIEHNKRDKLFK